MRHVTLAATCALLLAAAPAGAATQTWFGFQFGVGGGSAPPFPWRMEPHVVVVNSVAVVQDDHCDEDVFRYGSAWWRLRGGWWYRGASWRGPWRSVDVRIVPGPVLRVPAERWKHRPRGAAGRFERRDARRDARADDRHDRRADRSGDRTRPADRGPDREHDRD